MNAELSHLNDWFCASKLSLNTDKTKYVLLHNVKIRYNLPLVLPDLLMMLKSKERTEILRSYD